MCMVHSKVGKGKLRGGGGGERRRWEENGGEKERGRDKGDR